VVGPVGAESPAAPAASECATRPAGFLALAPDAPARSAAPAPAAPAGSPRARPTPARARPARDDSPSARDLENPF
jgi:hypothetical protein